MNDENGNSSGHVRVFQYIGSSWFQLGTDINGEAAEDRFGSSVSLSSDGRTVASGALFNDGNGSNSGHVRVFSIGGTLSAVSANITGALITQQLIVNSNASISGALSSSSANLSGSLSVGGSISSSGSDFFLWNSARGGAGTSSGRALVHLGSGTKALSILSINHDSDFGGGTQISGSVRITEPNVNGGNMGTINPPVSQSILKMGLTDFFPQIRSIRNGNFTDETDLQFWTSGGNIPAFHAMTIKGHNAHGRVGIGTTNPSSILNIFGGHLTVQNAFNAGNQNATILSMRARDHTINIREFSIKHLSDGNGNYSMGFLSRNATTEAEITILKLFTGGAVQVISLNGPGTRNVSANSDGILVISSSDRRLKENIEPIDESETHLKLLTLEPKTYQWKDREHNGDYREIGLIAQEVKEVLPELVFENNNGMYGLHYDKVSILMLQSIKQLQKQIDELKNEIIQLKK